MYCTVHSNATNRTIFVSDVLTGPADQGDLSRVCVDMWLTGSATARCRPVVTEAEAMHVLFIHAQ